MGIIEYCLKKPVLVAVAVLFLMLSGIWALLSIPIQLTPDIESPSVSVRTYWPGASPYEVEREIVRPQEEFLDNLVGLERMTSEARPGRGRIDLEFEIGADIDAAVLHISNQIDQVTSYPENVLKPTLRTAGTSNRPIIWIQLRAVAGNARNIRHYQQFAEDQIVPELEKIPGVSEAGISGGRNSEVHVRIDARKLSLHGITLDLLTQRIRAENADISGGSFSQGKRDYTVRTVSAFSEPEDLGNIILKATASGPVYLRDVADVGMGYKTVGTTVMNQDGRAIVLRVYKEQGANVLEIVQRVRAAIDKLNGGLLAREKLEMKVLSDPEYYINSAIDLVLQNIYLGGLLAVMVLYLFLGSLRSALVVAFSIPVSIVGTFVFLNLLDRNINVISLAGLAFAVGMVMDAAIVVLENIDAWRRKGHTLPDSLVRATKEVYGAILASSLTTVAVFLPVVFVHDQAGQLFRDIAIAICCAIILSFLVSTLVIPPLYQVLYGRLRLKSDAPERANVLIRWFRARGARSVELLLVLLHWLLARVWRKLAVVVGITVAAIVVTRALMPQQEYLPGGNRNLLLSILFPPPGYSQDEIEAVGKGIVQDLRPLLDGTQPGAPRVQRLFFVGFGTTLIMGVVAEEPSRVKELRPHINRVLRAIPGMRSVTSQTSLFSRGLAAARSIDVEVYGDGIEETARVTQQLWRKIGEAMPGSQIRPIPSFDLSTPELRVIAHPERAAAAGITTRELGIIVDILTDGRKVGEFSMPGGERVDLTLLAGGRGVGSAEDLAGQPLLSPNSSNITVGAVAQVVETVGPQEIHHIGGKRAFILRVKPPDSVSLEAALEILQTQVAEPARVQFAGTPGFNILLSGTADAFTKTRKALQNGFILAIGICFLLLVILFEDVLSPLVIMAALPVASAGGMVALWLMNTFVAPQPLDMLTLLGFLMMIGIVVNNPILIITLSLTRIREEGRTISEAVVEAVQSRTRPIMMTTLTSVFGLMPLVLMPGAGSELYRGLGAAVLGGLLLSTVVNLLFVPCLFSLFQDLQGLFRGRRAPVGTAGAVPELARTA